MKKLFIIILWFFLAGCGGGGGDNGAPSNDNIPGGAPTVTTLSATAISVSGATLNGNVNPGGLSTTAWFEWGTSSTLAASTATQGQAVGTGTSGIPISKSLSGLSSGSTYYYRIAASNSIGTTRGSIRSFILNETPATGALIVDHTSVAAFDSIPAQWIEAAKQLTLHYGHTSHGSQITSGLEALELADPTYGVAFRYSATILSTQEDPPVLRISYISSDPTGYWSTDTGREATRSTAATGNFNYSMWSWCGELSYASSSTVQQYLDTLNVFETDYPSMRFIYMTGHTDGTDTPTTPDTLKYNNNLIRNYAIANNKVLFDFADIESYDPEGNYYVNDSEGNCTWCGDWCDSHPEDCTSLPSSCAHTHPYICKIKAKAFWYMMARLAGWDGN